MVDVEDGIMAPSGTNKKVTAQLLANELGKLTNITAAGSTASRLLANRFAEVANVKDFGAVGDGTTNDIIAITSAIATNKPVYFPPGIYKVNYNSLSCFTLPSNCVLFGAGNQSSKILFEAFGSAIAYSELIRATNNNISIEDIAIEVNEVISQQIVIIRGGGSFVDIQNVKMIGNVSDDGTTTNSKVYGFSVPGSGTQTDIGFKNCQFTKLSWVFLKANISTAINKRISFIECDFYDNYGEDISFNSPNGVFSDFFIIGNNFYNPKGITNKIAIAIASCKNGVIESNVIQGSYGKSQLGAIHLEEDSQYISISNNSVSISGSGATGVILLWNDVSGTGYSPQNISITGNTLNYYDVTTGSGSRGVQLNNDVNGDPSNIVINSNVIKNYEFGIVLAPGDNENVIVSSNVVDGSTQGIRVGGGGPNLNNNSTSNCSVGIESTGGGGCTVVSNHNFIKCELNYNTSSGLRPLSLIDPSFEFQLFNVSAGSNTELTIGPITSSDRCYGQLSSIASTSSTSTDVSIKLSLSTWDGTTFTNTVQSSYEPGVIQTVPISSSNLLKIKTFSASARSNVRVQAKLNGILSMDR
jgi:hypothetical protein